MHPAVKENHALASTRLLQLRPEVVRTKDCVIAFNAGDPIYPCPYDYIAVGSKAALQLAKAGCPVVAVYLPAGETVSDLIPHEMLIGTSDITTVDDLEDRNYIVLDDKTFNESYSHVKESHTEEEIPVGIKRLAGILNYKTVHIKPIFLPKLHLMVQLWKPKQNRRLKELITCLCKNVQNPLIESIHVFFEKDSGLRINDILKDVPLELRQKVSEFYINERLTYKFIMEYLTFMSDNSNDIVGYANADIFFDETIRELWNIDMRDRCIALLRHDCSTSWASGDHAAPEPRIYGPRDDSQDAWFFKASSLKERKDAGEIWTDLDFEVGRAGCHNCFAGELVRRRWLLGNPALSIKAYHLHESPERTYKETDLVSRGVYATVAHSGILESSLLRQNAFPNRVAVKMMDTMAPVIESWPGGDAAPYERGLKSIMSSLSDAAIKPNTERTYHIIKTDNVCITPEGLISSAAGIGFGFDIDASELLWAQTTFSSISPTIAVESAVFFPSGDIGTSFSHQLWAAARAATIWSLSGGSAGQITISGSEGLPAMQPYYKFLGVKYVEGVLAVKGEARGLLPDTANQRLLEPVVKTLRSSLGEALLGDIITKPGHWTSIGCNEDLVDAINMKGVSIDMHTIEPTSWIGKFMRQLSEAEVVVIGHPVAVPNLWIMRPGSLVLDIAPTLAAARMATACGLRYMPFIFDDVGHDEMARILVKGAGGFKPSAATNGLLPKIYVPAVRTDGFHKHVGDGFRELVELWSEAGYIERIFHNGVFCWLGSIGDTLLYDRRSDDWLQTDVPEAEKTHKRLVKVEDVINWARRPRLVAGTAAITQRKKNLVFYGHIETARHFRVRSAKATGIDWSSACDDFAMPVGSKYQYSQTEYLDRIKDSYYGLCLPGTGARTNREAEYVALGIVPIFVGGSAPSKTGSQTLCGAQPTPGLKKGIHYLEAATLEEATAIVSQAQTSITAASDWIKMSAACRAFYEANWSPEASWTILNNHCTSRTD